MSNQEKDAAKVYAQISVWCKQWVRAKWQAPLADEGK